MPKKKLTIEELQRIVCEESDSDVDFEDSGSEYLTESSDDTESATETVNNLNVPCEHDEKDDESQPLVQWVNFTADGRQNFKPKYEFPTERACKILLDLTDECNEYKVFSKIFPYSLCIRIAECTNQRLKTLNRRAQSKRNLTDPNEILVFLGVSLIMHYNKLPCLKDYWSKNPSMGNSVIKSCISRDRFLLLASKLYFNDCEKPTDACKDYYISDVVTCLKYTFAAARSESSFQSIDECMVKFKGRSSMKQYMPMKPIKRGTKIWMRCDSKTGYSYDLNIYTGKEENAVQSNIGTLGERVVSKLVSSIREKDVCLAFDRFFTSIKLLETIEFPALGTYMQNRKNTPKFTGKLNRGESQLQTKSGGILAARWMDSKEVLLASNCHAPSLVDIERKQKDGSKKKIKCPKSISDYNIHMGGVDLSDQKTTVYDFDRKSQKWWKKVFYKLLMVCVVNSWIVYTEHKKEKISLKDFLVPLAESMISEGSKRREKMPRHQGGRPPKRPKTDSLNVGDHLPVEQEKRCRCVRCTSLGIEKRTKMICSGCNNALCYKCFGPFHKLNS